MFNKREEIDAQYHEMYEDRISDLEARVESLERYVSERRRTIDNIHPVIYNIQEKK